MGKANMAIACIGTIMGFATSAVVAEVRGRAAEPVQLTEARTSAQFRPAFEFRGVGFVSTSAPVWRPLQAPTADMTTRSILAAARTAGSAR